MIAKRTTLGITLALIGWSVLIGTVMTLHGSKIWRRTPGTVPADAIRFAHDASKDPRMGSTLELLHRTTGTSLREGPILVVLMGDCQGCTSNVFHPNKVEAASYSHVVLVYVGPEEEVRRINAFDDSRITVVADAEGSWHSSLNASWTPRFYCYSQDLSLVAIQESPHRIPDFVKLRNDEQFEEVKHAE